MNSEWTIEKALEKGAEMELTAHNFYTEQAEKAIHPGAKKFLTELAADEKVHRAKFLQALENPSAIEIDDVHEDISDLMISDYLVKITLDSKSDYQQILIYAAQDEKRAHDFYVQIARKYKGTLLGDMLTSFAKDELRHKYALEKEYDDVVLREM